MERRHAESEYEREMERLETEKRERERREQQRSTEAAQEPSTRGGPSTSALQAAMLAALASFSAKTEELRRAVELSQVESIEQAREDTERMWAGLQPAFKLLTDSLPRHLPPSAGGGGGGDLPWGFGQRNNTLRPDELIKQGKLLPEGAVQVGGSRS